MSAWPAYWIGPAMPSLAPAPMPLAPPPRRRAPRLLSLTLLFLAPLMACLLVVLAHLTRAEQANWEYAKLSAPRTPSLVVGGSRGAWAVRPDAFASPMVNFAFGIHASPYGEIYHRAILKKAGSHTGGVYILEVMPLNLLLYAGEDETSLRERSELLGRVRQVWGRPNLEYMLRYRLPQILGETGHGTVGAWLRDSLSEPETREPRRKAIQAFDDGWIKVTLNDDLESRADRFARHMEDDRELLAGGRRSTYRLDWLARTAAELQTRGRVFLVRLPASRQMLELENEFWPEFDAEIEAITRRTGARYVNLFPFSDDDLTVESCHLDDDACLEVSRLLARLAETAGLPQGARIPDTVLREVALPLASEAAPGGFIERLLAGTSPDGDD